MMIDYRNEKGNICRRSIDNMEFCIRDGEAYFISNGIKYHVPIERIIQVYPG